MLSTFSVNCLMQFTGGPAYAAPPGRLWTWQLQALNALHAASSQWKDANSLQQARPHNKLKVNLRVINLLTPTWVEGFFVSWLHRRFINSFDQFKRYLLHAPGEEMLSRHWQGELTSCHRHTTNWETHCCLDLLAERVVYFWINWD